MQFQVPQFIEVEDKIFGPLTFKQFIYLAGGAGFAYILWRILPIFLSAPLIAAIIGFGVALAFFKYNGRPFILAIEHAFFYFTRSKLYLWSSDQKASRKGTAAATALNAGDVYVPKLSDSKLHELAWSLDIKERIAAGIQDDDRDEIAQHHDVTSMRTSHDALIQ